MVQRFQESEDRNSMKIGLTLGKYAPFHKGHQYLLDTALKEMDQVICIIYNAHHVTDIPLNIRANWIRQIYPMVEVIEAWDGPIETGYTPEIMRLQENYIGNLLKKFAPNRTITHFYSSEQYGDHMSKFLKCADRRVDVSRVNLPICATDIRKDPYKHRHMVDPVVYRSLIKNIVFMGAPSTGKSTLSKAIAEKFNTTFMPEYGREYWAKHQVDRRLTREQLVEIAETHVKLEDYQMLQANKYLFTDTNAITTMLFSRYYHNAVNTRLAELADKCQSRYDLFFLCDMDIPYDDTEDRSGETHRLIFQRQTIAELKTRKIPYKLLTGTVDDRIFTASHYINEMFNKRS